MACIETYPLPYLPDTPRLFQRIRHLPYPVLLDSGYPDSPFGRFDIISAQPLAMLQSYDDHSVITRDGHAQIHRDDPFQLLRALLEQYCPHAPAPSDALPFHGGALGYFAYDLGRRIETLPQRAEADIAMPLMSVGIYAWAVINDHQAQRCYWVGPADLAGKQALLDLLQRESEPAAQPEFRLNAPFQANMSQAEYLQRFQRVIDYILAGDCYQINLAQRFSAPYQGDPWQAFLRLRQATPAPFAAYLETPSGTLLSHSPERFLQVTAGRVETKPIKGTRPRGQTPAADAALAHELQHSSKDRAENLMIVDLLRNDIGKVCAPGSVRVPKLFALESFANVHHLVSTVTGELASGQHAVDLLRACFPGGSITGAPKIRAMEIIEELEPQRRAQYCGSVGYIDFNGDMDTNIAIRSLICHDGQIHCWGGGGIVADSQGEAEYAETLAKVGRLLSTLETMGAECTESGTG